MITIMTIVIIIVIGVPVEITTHNTITFTIIIIKSKEILNHFQQIISKVMKWVHKITITNIDLSIYQHVSIVNH